MNNLPKAGEESCSDHFTTSPKISILFVCLGNICKPSPLSPLSPHQPLPRPPFNPSTQLTTHRPPLTGRSPMAEAVFRSLLTSSPASPSSPRIARIDSAGTAAYHAGSPPDPRTVSTLAAHGITDYVHSARMVRSEDFREFDYILAMDGENLRNLLRAREGEGGLGRREEAGGGKGEWKGKVMLFGEFGGRGAEEVVDPYYGEGAEGFEVAFEQMVRFSDGFLREVVGRMEA